MIDERFGERGTKVIGTSFVGRVLRTSAAPSGGDTFSYVHRKAFDVRLSSSREEFAKAGFLKYDEEDNSELWRISVRVAASAMSITDNSFATYAMWLDQLSMLMTREYAFSRSWIVGCMGVNRPEPVSFFGSSRTVPKQRALTMMTKSSRPIFQLCSANRAAKCSAFKPTRAQRPSANWKKLQATDAVVVLGKFNDSDLDTIRSVVPHTIDARVRQPSKQPHLAQLHCDLIHVAPTKQEVDAIYTGVVPIVYKAQRALLNSLVESTLWSFLTITPIMMFVSRSFAAVRSPWCPTCCQ